MFTVLHPIPVAVSTFFTSTATGKSLQDAFAEFSAGIVFGISGVAATVVNTIHDKFKDIGNDILDGLRQGWEDADFEEFFKHPFEGCCRRCQRVSRYRQPVNRIHANRTRLDWWPDHWYRLNDCAYGVISGNVGQLAFAAVPTLA